MRRAWNKGLTKESNQSVRSISETMKAREIDNFKRWRENARRIGKVKDCYQDFARDGDLAELIGVVLGDGHIGKFPRCESLRIVGSANNPGFSSRYANIVEQVIGKKPHVSRRSQANAINITVYEKDIARRLGLPVGSKKEYDFVLPAWIREDREMVLRFLRGLYEAEGSLCHHPPTSTHKLLFANRNASLLKLVYELVSSLGFKVNMSGYKVQVSREKEVQNLANLIQFRRYQP